MEIIKLTAKNRFTLRPDSAPEIEVNQHISIPPNHYGEFYIRKKFGLKGIDVPRSPFPANWEGTPEIVLIHNGANDEEFFPGDEIGELHIRYTPPSPFFGDSMAIHPPFAYKCEGDKLVVITEDVRKFECKELLLRDFSGHERLTVDNTEPVWRNMDFINSYKPSSTMVDYKQVFMPTETELHEAGICNKLSLIQGHMHNHVKSEGSSEVGK